MLFTKRATNCVLVLLAIILAISTQSRAQTSPTFQFSSLLVTPYHDSLPELGNHSHLDYVNNLRISLHLKCSSPQDIRFRIQFEFVGFPNSILENQVFLEGPAAALLELGSAGADRTKFEVTITLKQDSCVFFADGCELRFRFDTFVFDAATLSTSGHFAVRLSDQVAVYDPSTEDLIESHSLPGPLSHSFSPVPPPKALSTSTDCIMASGSDLTCEVVVTALEGQFTSRDFFTLSLGLPSPLQSAFNPPNSQTPINQNLGENGNNNSDTSNTDPLSWSSIPPSASFDSLGPNHTRDLATVSSSNSNNECGVEAPVDSLCTVFIIIPAIQNPNFPLVILSSRLVIRLFLKVNASTQFDRNTIRTAISWKSHLDQASYLGPFYGFLNSVKNSPNSSPIIRFSGEPFQPASLFPTNPSPYDYRMQPFTIRVRFSVPASVGEVNSFIFTLRSITPQDKASSPVCLDSCVLEGAFGLSSAEGITIVSPSGLRWEANRSATPLMSGQFFSLVCSNTLLAAHHPDHPYELFAAISSLTDAGVGGTTLFAGIVRASDYSNNSVESAQSVVSSDEKLVEQSVEMTQESTDTTKVAKMTKTLESTLSSNSPSLQNQNSFLAKTLAQDSFSGKTLAQASFFKVSRNLHPSAIRLSSPFDPSALIHNLTLDLGDICLWSQGDYFLIKPSIGSSPMLERIRNLFSPHGIRCNLSSLHPYTFVVQCTLRNAYPCAWGNRNKAAQAHNEEKWPSRLELELTFSSPLVPETNNQYYFDFEAHTSVDGSEFVQNERIPLVEPQPICPRILDPSSLHPGLIFPANINWLAKAGHKGEPLPRSQIQTSFRVFPLVKCNSSHTISSLFSSSPMSPLVFSSPTFLMTSVHRDPTLIEFGLQAENWTFGPLSQGQGDEGQGGESQGGESQGQFDWIIAKDLQSPNHPPAQNFLYMYDDVGGRGDGRIDGGVDLGTKTNNSLSKSDLASAEPEESDHFLESDHHFSPTSTPTLGKFSETTKSPFISLVPHSHASLIDPASVYYQFDLHSNPKHWFCPKSSSTSTQISSSSQTPPQTQIQTASTSSSTSTKSCLLPIPSLPFRDTFAYQSPHPNNQIPLTFLQASLSIGNALPNVFEKFPLIPLLSTTKLHHLDHLLFDFGHAPALINPKYFGTPEEVRIAVLSKNGRLLAPFSPTLPYVQTTSISHVSYHYPSYRSEELLIVNNVCIWEAFSKDATGKESLVEQVRAESPTHYSPSFYLSGDDSDSSANDYNTRNLDVLGVYGLPKWTQHTASSLSETVTSVRLVCFILPTDRDHGLEFALRFDGNKALSVPFTQPFAPRDSPTFNPNLHSIPSLLPFLRQVGSTLMYTPQQSYMESGGVFQMFLGVDLKFEMGLFDQFHFDLTNIPNWLKLDFASFRCVLIDTGGALTEIPSTEPVRSGGQQNGNFQTHFSPTQSFTFSFQRLLPSDLLTVNSRPLCHLAFSLDKGYRPVAWEEIGPHQAMLKVTAVPLAATFNPSFFKSQTISVRILENEWKGLPPRIMRDECEGDRFGVECEETRVELPTSTTGPIASLPTPSPRLPQTSPPPGPHCHAVRNVAGEVVRMRAEFEKMCTIPTAGILTTTTLPLKSLTPTNDFLFSDDIRQYYADLGEINLCDCSCKGFWGDNQLTTDFKKCSKCTIPNGGCPELMTPNADCTGCECVTPVCKGMSSYLFSSVYLDAKALRLFSTTSTTSPLPTVPQIESEMTDSQLEETIYNPNGLFTGMMEKHLARFGTFLEHHYSTVILPQHPSAAFPTIITKIKVAPMVEGTYSALLVTFSVLVREGEGLSGGAGKTNGKVVGPPSLHTLPNFGLPPFNKGSLAKLFVEWLVSPGGALGGYGLTVEAPLMVALSKMVHTPSFPFSSSSSSLSTSPLHSQSLPLSMSVLSDENKSEVAFFRSNSFSTRCISHQNHINLLNSTASNPFLLTPDLLHPCPLPGQYLDVPIDVKLRITKEEREERLKTLNPLWSPCTPTPYLDHDTLLHDSPAQVTVDVRHIYPRCVDFAGVDLGRFGVPCEALILPKFHLFSKTHHTLLNPTYTAALMSSFNMKDVPGHAEEIVGGMRRLGLQLPKFPHFPITTSVICRKVENSENSENSESSPNSPNSQLDLNSLIATPTVLGTESHLHMSWAYQGDDTKHVTLAMKPAKKRNEGSGQFVFSQILGTFPLSELFSTAQLPTASKSALISSIYDMYHASEASEASLQAPQPPSSSNSSSSSDSSDSQSTATVQTGLGSVYGLDNQVTIFGFLTQDAGAPPLTLGQSQSQSQANQEEQQEQQELIFDFNLALHCTLNKVSCFNPKTQFCHQGDARCLCRPGYRPSLPLSMPMGSQDSSGSRSLVTQSFPYEPNLTQPGHLIDGRHLECVPICQHGGEFQEQTGKCKCQENTRTGGDFCEIPLDCDNSTCNKNGFIPVSNPSTCSPVYPERSSPCQCFGSWTDLAMSPLEGFSDSTSPPTTPVSSSQCRFCPLWPYSPLFYTQPELDHIRNWYSADETTVRGVFQEETVQVQTYATEAQTQAQVPQRCFLGGTDITLLSTQCPTKCPCLRGFGGAYCHLHVLYSTFRYKGKKGTLSKSQNTDNNEGNDGGRGKDEEGEPLGYNYDQVTQRLLFEKFKEEVALSLAQRFDPGDVFVEEHDLKSQTVTVGIFTGTDFFKVNQEAEQQSSNFKKEKNMLFSFSFSLFSLQHQSQPTPSTSTSTLMSMSTSLSDNWSSLPPNLDNLYSQWGNFQNNFDQSPIRHQDSSAFLGELEVPSDLDDPACSGVDGLLGCANTYPNNKSGRNMGLIIGVVLGCVGGAGLILAILVVILLWCRRNQRGLWKPAEKQDQDERSNFSLTPSHPSTGKATTTTSQNGLRSGVEMASGTAQGTAQPGQSAQSVQSVNNQIEIKDPTLPSQWKAYKNGGDQSVFYVNTVSMTTQWNHPIEPVGRDGGGTGKAENEYGW